MQATPVPQENGQTGQESPCDIPELFCDLVMKGGITSGVVYPKLITGLSAKYRFKNIGGASAGAIAAAGCAAAEFRRLSGASDGFLKLHKLPEELGTPVGEGHGSLLQNLFQPSAALKRHFDVLMAALNRPSKLAILAGALGTLIWRYWGLVVLAALAALIVFVSLVRSTGPIGWGTAGLVALACAVIWLVAGWLLIWKPAQQSKDVPIGKRLLVWWLGGTLAVFATLAWLNYGEGHLDWLASGLAAASWSMAMPIALVLVFVLCAWKFTTSLLSGLQANFWGICSGLTTSESGSTKGLTEWLVGYINTLAGLDPNERPLTLGDLWDGKRTTGGDESVKTETPLADRTINMEVMTTAVSRKMPYAIPFREGVGSYYFDPEEWKRIFPESVMTWLAQVSTKARPDGTNWIKSNRILWQLPCNRHLPVVLLVRMSLSFPVLLSAVPMYAYDFSSGSESKNSKKVWFSDGGIGSNMPLHFFDAPLPRHPTFAVNLKDEQPGHPIRTDVPTCSPDNGRVYLPNKSLGGLQQYWSELDDASPAGIFGFLWRIVETMHNWHDEMQLPMPGYRDRVVQIAQKNGEGGLNLNMPPESILALSDAGACAAEKLIDRFYPSSATGKSEGWEQHRNIRIRTFLALAEMLGRHPSMHDAQWMELVESGELSYTAKERAVGAHILESLATIGKPTPHDEDLVMLDKAPRPRPQWRIVPKI